MDSVYLACLCFVNSAWIVFLSYRINKLYVINHWNTKSLALISDYMSRLSAFLTKDDDTNS